MWFSADCKKNDIWFFKAHLHVVEYFEYVICRDLILLGFITGNISFEPLLVNCDKNDSWFVKSVLSVSNLERQKMTFHIRYHIFELYFPDVWWEPAFSEESSMGVWCKHNYGVRVAQKGNHCGNKEHLCRPNEPDITVMNSAQKKHTKLPEESQMWRVHGTNPATTWLRSRSVARWCLHQTHRSWRHSGSHRRQSRAT